MKKINFESFLTTFRHGIYVFVNDSCQACTDYAKTLEKIDSDYLYIVECILSSEKEIVKKMFNKLVFPLTVTIDKYEIKSVEPGILFEKQLQVILKELQYFENTKLTDSEINDISNHYNNKCFNTFYMAPKNIDQTLIETRLKELKYVGLAFFDFNISMNKLYDIVENMNIIIFTNKQEKNYVITNLQIMTEMKKRNKNMQIIEI